MDTEVKAENLREDERILQAVDKCISSKEDEHERNKGILKEILNDVFATMKGRNAFFREQYRGFFFVDSYDKGMEVGKVKDFHVNIIIEIPLNYDSIELFEGRPGYNKLRLPNKASIYTPQWDKYKPFLSTWLMKETSGNFLYLDKDAFRHSINSVLAKARLNIPKIDNYTVNRRSDDPPFTLRVMKQGFPEMNVTFVPVIELPYHWTFHLTMKSFNWYAVAEISQNAEDEHLQWRADFYNHENDLLTRHSYVKPVIRQIERLRDIQFWNFITAYHIKTLFMHYAITTEDKSGVPDDCKLTGIKLFIHILNELRNVCTSGNLKNCWIPKHNLIDAIESRFADIGDQLAVIIEQITDDPAKVGSLLVTLGESSFYENELKAIGNVEDIDGPSKSLQMSEESEPGSSKDIIKTADEVSESVPGAAAASGSVKSSPFTGAVNDKADCSEERDLLGVVAGLKDTIETQARLLKTLQQISAETA